MIAAMIQNKMEFVMVNWEPQHAVHQPKNVGWVVGIVTLTRIAGLDSSVEITIVTEILNSLLIQRMIAAMIQNKMEFVMVNLEPQHAVHLTRSVGWVAVIVTLIKIVRPDSNVEITIVTEILNSMPIQRMIAAMIQNKMEFVMVNWEPQHAVHLTRSVGWVAVIVTLIRIVRLDSNVEITIATEIF